MARITPPSGGLSEPLALVSPLTVDQIDETTPDAGVTIETVLLKDGQVDGVDVSALDAFPYTFPFDFLAAPVHATLHSDGGTDEVTVENLATAGAVNAVPTSDGAGGLAMSVPALGGPTIYLVTADQDIDTDITMNNVTNMAWTVEAGHTYYVEGILRTISPAAADVDLLVTIPAGADVLLNTLGLTAPGSTLDINGGGFDEASEGVGILSTGSTQYHRLAGVLHIGGTGGTVQLQFGQRTSNAGTTSILEGTFALVTDAGVY